MNANAIAGPSTASAYSLNRQGGLASCLASPVLSRDSRDSSTSERPLSLSRIHRLLRPLRAAIQRLGQAPSLVGSAPSSRSASVSSRPRAFGPRDSDDSDDGDWRARRKDGSSPFGRRRNRAGRTTKQYGSKAVTNGSRDQGVARYQEPFSLGGASLAEILDRYHRYSAGDQSADAFLRAYSNILEAVYSGASRKGKLSSLAEVSARQIGATIETELQACLSIVSSSDDESADEDGDNVRAPAMERTASAQEAELDAARLQDEWYEACPQEAWRWLLAEHATAIVVDALTSQSALEACFSICLLHGAETEASRFYAPLISKALYTSESIPRPHILTILHTCPSPLRLVETALVPTLLESAFADRLFYHQYLAIAPVSSRLREEDALPTARLAAGLLHVAAQMIRSVVGQVADLDDPDYLDRMIDEITDRLVAQIRHCVVLWMRSDRRTCLEAVRDALDGALESAADADLVSGSEATGRLLSYALVIELALVADGVSSSPRLDSLYDLLLSTMPIDSDGDSPAETAAHALRSTLLSTFCPAHSLDQAFALCDSLSDSSHGPEIATLLLEAYSVRKGLSHYDRERLAGRLSTLTAALPVGGASPQIDAPSASSRAVSIEPDPENSTDYDEPFPPSPLRRPAKRAKKRLVVVVSSDSDRASVGPATRRICTASPASAPTRPAAVRRVDVYLDPPDDRADSSDSLDLLQTARRRRSLYPGPSGARRLEAESTRLVASPERASSPERAFSPLRPLSFSDAPPSLSPSPTPPIQKARLVATTAAARSPEAPKHDSRPDGIKIASQPRRRLSPRKVSLGRLAKRRKAFGYAGDASSSEDELLL